MREEERTFCITSGLLPDEDRRQVDLKQEECSIDLLSKSSYSFLHQKEGEKIREREREKKMREEE